MTNGESGHTDLRAQVPTLEPDEVFLARLSALAAGSVARPPAGARPRPGWRIGLVAASVAAVVAGVALLVGVLSGGQPTSPAPVQPATHQSPSVEDSGDGSPTGTGSQDSGVPGASGASAPQDSGGAGTRAGATGPSPQDGTPHGTTGQGGGDDSDGDRPGGDRGGSDEVRKEHQGAGRPDHAGRPDDTPGTGPGTDEAVGAG